MSSATPATKAFFPLRSMPRTRCTSLSVAVAWERADRSLLLPAAAAAGRYRLGSAAALPSACLAARWWCGGVLEPRGRAGGERAARAMARLAPALATLHARGIIAMLSVPIVCR